MFSRMWHFLGRITFYQSTENVYKTFLTPSLRETPSVYCRYTEEMPHVDSSDSINYRSTKRDIQNILERRALKVQICPSPLFFWDPSIQFWGPQHRGHIGLLQWVQKRVREMIKGMEHFSYEERLKRTGIIQLGEQEALGSPRFGLPGPEGRWQESWRETLYKGLDWRNKGEWFQTDKEWV